MGDKSPPPSSPSPPSHTWIISKGELENLTNSINQHLALKLRNHKPDCTPEPPFFLDSFVYFSYKVIVQTILVHLRKIFSLNFLCLAMQSLQTETVLNGPCVNFFNDIFGFKWKKFHEKLLKAFDILKGSFLGIFKFPRSFLKIQ